MVAGIPMISCMCKLMLLCYITSVCLLFNVNRVDIFHILIWWCPLVARRKTLWLVSTVFQCYSNKIHESENTAHLVSSVKQIKVIRNKHWCARSLCLKCLWTMYLLHTVHVMMKTMFKCCLSIGKNMFKWHLFALVSSKLHAFMFHLCVCVCVSVSQWGVALSHWESW